MRIDAITPGFCRCHRPYEAPARTPYPYLPSHDDPAPDNAGTHATVALRPCRILPALPIPGTFRNGLSTERTPSVIHAGSDLRTTAAARRRHEIDGLRRRDRHGR